jgi:hypothetical protein
MTATKYLELQALTKKYGEETLMFHSKVKEIGSSLIKFYVAYLGGPVTAANPVPPHGDFEAREIYRDAAYDSYGRNTIYLEPIRMGICTEIGNQSGNGATWVRTIIEFNPCGSGVRLNIGSRATQFHIGENSQSIMADICEAIFLDACEAFSIEINQAQGRFKIGYV